MSRNDFFGGIPAGSATAVVALERFCRSNIGLEAYYTGTNKADIRVRLVGYGRTVFTATYQNRNQQFLCRAYCVPETIIALGIPQDRVNEPAQPTEPQRSEFRLTPAEFDNRLLSVVLAAALAFLHVNGTI